MDSSITYLFTYSCCTDYSLYWGVLTRDRIPTMLTPFLLCLLLSYTGGQATAQWQGNEITGGVVDGHDTSHYCALCCATQGTDVCAQESQVLSLQNTVQQLQVGEISQCYTYYFLYIILQHILNNKKSLSVCGVLFLSNLPTVTTQETGGKWS